MLVIDAVASLMFFGAREESLILCISTISFSVDFISVTPPRRPADYFSETFVGFHLVHLALIRAIPLHGRVIFIRPL
jgi:hypothetical protein